MVLDTVTDQSLGMGAYKWTVPPPPPSPLDPPGPPLMAPADVRGLNERVAAETRLPVAVVAALPRRAGKAVFTPGGQKLSHLQAAEREHFKKKGADTVGWQTGDSYEIK